MSQIDGLLSQIRSSCIDPKTSAVTLLRQVRVLAHELKRGDLDQWAIRELDGYFDVSEFEIPDYRKVGLIPTGHFSGPFGSGLRNAPIHTFMFPSDLRTKLDSVLRTVWAREPISVYEAINDTDQGVIHFDLSHLAPILAGRVYEDMNCLQVHGACSVTSLKAIPEGVKNRILSLVLELARAFPASKGDFLLKDSEPLNHIINTVINGGQANIAIASEQFQQIGVSVNGPGDLEGLRATLFDSGLPESYCGEVLSAVESEMPVQGEIGPKVSSVMAKILGLAADGTWKLSIAAAAKLLADAISRYYGLSSH